MARKLVLAGSLLALMAALVVATAASKGPPPRPARIDVTAQPEWPFGSGAVVSSFWTMDTYTLKGLEPNVPVWVSLDVYPSPTCEGSWAYNWWSVYEQDGTPPVRPVLLTDKHGNASGHYAYPDALPERITELGSPIGVQFTFGYDFCGDGAPYACGEPHYFSDCMTVDLP
jgi:hypothetical protein